MVHNNVASKDPNICYAAKLLGMQGEKFSKPKKVVCFISPKQLTIKEYLLRIIPKRLVTFRLCPSTKVSNSISRKGKIKIFFSIQGKKNKKKLEATREMVDIRNL